MKEKARVEGKETKGESAMRTTWPISRQLLTSVTRFVVASGDLRGCSKEQGVSVEVARKVWGGIA